jgi:hypothetical protein
MELLSDCEGPSIHPDVDTVPTHTLQQSNNSNINNFLSPSDFISVINNSFSGPPWPYPASPELCEQPERTPDLPTSAPPQGGVTREDGHDAANHLQFLSLSSWYYSGGD